MRGDVKSIGVFGTWRAPVGSALYQQAYELGRAAAGNGLVVVTGGYSGIMEAAARGAFEAGGVAVGVVCPELDAQLSANSYLTEVVRESNLLRRAARCLEMSERMVFFPGRTGTAGELTLALDLVSKRAKEPPLVLWGAFWEAFVAALCTSNEMLQLPSDGESVKHLYKVACGPAEVLALI
jgi:hypothetical protein